MATPSRSKSLLLLYLLCLVSILASASAYKMCVADVSQARQAGQGYPWFPCKDQRTASGNDFKFSKLRDQGNTSNAFNATGTLGLVPDWPGLNSLGLGIARLDLAPGGVIPPHSHPAASELLFVLEGSIYTGFVSSDNKLYAATVEKGEAFVLPQGLLHFQHNTGNTHASGVSFMNAEDPGMQMLPLALFAGGLSSKVVAKSVFISEKEAVIEADILRSKYETFKFVH